MKLKSTLLAVLVFFSAFVFASIDINPTVTSATFCSGDTMTIIIATTDTFPTGNIFTIKLANGLSGLSNPPTIGHVAGQGNDTVKIVAPSVNGTDFYLAVVSSSDSVGVDLSPITINTRPVVNLTLPQNTFCTFASAVTLSGGNPLGGVFSGNYVQGTTFEINQSGIGTFEVYYTDSANAGCYATDSAAITVSTCPAPSVSVQVSPASLCPGSVMNINIETSDVLAFDNIFTVQLSDSTGSFVNATVLALDTATGNNNLQIATPVEPAGSGYKVRVIASDPLTNGVPFNVTFRALLPAPNISLNTSDTLNLCTKDSFKLKVDSLNGISYQWTHNGFPLSVPNYTYLAKDSGLYVVNFTDTTAAGCSSGADSVFIGIYPYPAKPVVFPRGIVNHCGGLPVTLSDTASHQVTFQWLNHGQNIAGETQNTYTAVATGIYVIKVISSKGCASKSDSVYVNIHTNPTVTFNLFLDSFCLHSAPILLSGGSPDTSGTGFYSGTYVTNNATFNQTLSGVGAFEVYYTYSDTIGCTGTDSTKIHIYDCTTSGIAESANEHTFQMFPNPATGQVHISATAGNCKMKLFNLLGQEISSQPFNQELTYSVDQLPGGVYLVEISDLSNTWKAVKRLVIQ